MAATPNTIRRPMTLRITCNAMFQKTCLTQEADGLANSTMMAHMWECNNDRFA
jgi:hypothetical protein